MHARVQCTHVYMYNVYTPSILFNFKNMGNPKVDRIKILLTCLRYLNKLGPSSNPGLSESHISMCRSLIELSSLCGEEEFRGEI